MRVARAYYQNPVVEIVFVGTAGLAHVATGLLRLAARRRRARAERAAGRTPPRVPTWLRLHRASGYFLLLVIVGHVLATRGPSLALGIEIDASYLSFSLVTWPWMFYPYYVVLFSCGLYHGAQGASAALRLVGLPLPFGLGKRRPASAIALLGLGVAAGLAGILALGGVTREVDRTRFEEFRAPYTEYLPFMLPGAD